MKTNSEKIKEFHQKFNHPCPTIPTFPDQNLLNLRVELIREEFEELKESALKNDFVGIADALGDLLVVTYGAAIAFGLPIDKIFEEIHSSNMSKLGADGLPIYRDDGKILKGPNYRAPNLMEIIYGGNR